MQTLTITNAKKNLSRWLQAAARGEDIGIVSGADIIALRKVTVESTDYAQREFGVTPNDIDRFAESADARFARLKRAGKLLVSDPAKVREVLEKAARD